MEEMELHSTTRPYRPFTGEEDMPTITCPLCNGKKGWSGDGWINGVYQGYDIDCEECDGTGKVYIYDK